MKKAAGKRNTKVELKDPSQSLGLHKKFVQYEH
jgi:hypothetical protein